MNIIDKNINDIKTLCRQHKVAKLFLFGSILTEKFKDSSDIDLLVDFSGVSLYEYADNYFELKNSLEKLLNRKIDLLEEKAVKNPYLRKTIDSTKLLIYG
jgi:uncharacterized protein